MQSKLLPGDPKWRQFNASFTNLELHSIDIADNLAAGRPITTWHKDRWRTSSNYILGQHLGLDFDTCDKASSIPQLLKDPFVYRHGGILYATPSHTPDTPRSRVIFLLDTPIHQPRNYCLAAAALLWVFGAADRQCKDAARFFYGGKPGACDIEWLGNELPLEMVKDLIQRYQATGQSQRRRIQRQYAPQSADEREVVEALKHVNPWQVAYDDWVAILMAIHSELPGPDGLRIAESWAEGYQGEVEQKWRSFSSAGNVSGRVGIGTLFKLAKDNGWTPSRQTVPGAMANN